MVPRALPPATHLSSTAYLLHDYASFAIVTVRFRRLEIEAMLYVTSR
jgi:hypothetical protein